MDWWLMIRTDDQRLHCWQLGDRTPEIVARLITCARISVGIPATDTLPSRVWQTLGQPHAHTLATADVHPLTDFDRISASQVSAYDTAQAEASRTLRLDDVQASITRLPDADRTALRGRLGWDGPRPSGGKV